MNKSQLQVKEFREAFGLPVNTTPQVTISRKNALLHAKLIYEESMECIAALGCEVDSGQVVLQKTGMFQNGRPTGEFSLVEVIDGLCDLEYICEGAVCEFGVDLEPAKDAVHKNNMSKMWTEQEWSATVAEGRSELEGLTAKTDGNVIFPLFAVTRADGKIIKSPGHKKVDLAAVLEKQMP